MELDKSRIYIIYDETALYDDPEKAKILKICRTLEEALNYKGEIGDGAVIYSYRKFGTTLVDETFEQILVDK